MSRHPHGPSLPGQVAGWALILSLVWLIGAAIVWLRALPIRAIFSP